MPGYKIRSISLFGGYKLEFCSKGIKFMDCSCESESGNDKTEKFTRYLLAHGFKKEGTSPFKFVTKHSMSYRAVMASIGSFLAANFWFPREVPSIRLYDEQSEILLEKDSSPGGMLQAELFCEGEEEKDMQPAKDKLAVMRIGYALTSERPENAYACLVGYYTKNGFYHSRKVFYSSEKISAQHCKRVIDSFFERYPQMRRYIRELTVFDGNVTRNITEEVRNAGR